MQPTDCGGQSALCGIHVADRNWYQRVNATPAIPSAGNRTCRERLDMIAFLQSRSRDRLLPWCCVVLAGFLLCISSLAAEEPGSILARAQWDDIWRRIGQVDHLRATDATDMGEREDLWGRGLPNPDLRSCLWKAAQTSCYSFCRMARSCDASSSSVVPGSHRRGVMHKEI